MVLFSYCNISCKTRRNVKCKYCNVWLCSDCDITRICLKCQSPTLDPIPFYNKKNFIMNMINAIETFLLNLYDIPIRYEDHNYNNLINDFNYFEIERRNIIIAFWRKKYKIEFMEIFKFLRKLLCNDVLHHILSYLSNHNNIMIK